MGLRQSSLENLVSTVGTFNDGFAGKTVLVTGHTGFKGSWLSHWLLRLGAKVHGTGLEAEDFGPGGLPTLFEQLDLGGRLTSDHRVDVRHAEAVDGLIEQIKPDITFHLAAQPLVRLSYRQPVATITTNVIGTTHVLESLREHVPGARVVVVTTDKCYQNLEWQASYREEDPLGGHDPYSASKAAAEIVTAAYRSSFGGDGFRIASARAGNVIGGGDWAADRIVPDIFRAAARKKPVLVRNRHATRPWQHVLEPLSGYLWLATKLDRATPEALLEMAAAFNFGPALSSNQNVGRLVSVICERFGGHWSDMTDPEAPHEASRLNLAIDRSFHRLGWQPTWNFATTIAQTVDGYQAAMDGQPMGRLIDHQIDLYTRDAAAAGNDWAAPEGTQ